MFLDLVRVGKYTLVSVHPSEEFDPVALHHAFGGVQSQATPLRDFEEVHQPIIVLLLCFSTDDDVITYSYTPLRWCPCAAGRYLDSHRPNGSRRKQYLPNGVWNAVISCNRSLTPKACFCIELGEEPCLREGRA